MISRYLMARERGAAALLVALVLMISITLLTLAVAGTQLAETRMAGNDHRHMRLLLNAESAWAAAANTLRKGTAQLAWVPAGTGETLLSRPAATVGRDGVETRIVYHRRSADSPFIQIQTSARHPGGSGASARVSQGVRLLGVLSPRGESAPPLVINGCLSGAGRKVGIWPVNADRREAGDAIWRYAAGACPGLDAIDIHAGRIVLEPRSRSLWETIFSVSKDEYAQLVASERTRPATQRHYWMVDKAPAAGERWRRSLGSPARPVVLFFPRAAGCPRFGAGVRIYGVVFIESSCPEPLADGQLEIFGSLIVDGNADTGHAHVQLQHIQVADHRRTRLSLPVIRVVSVPGSWKDF